MENAEIYFNIAQLLMPLLGMLGIGLIPKYFYDKKLNELNNKITKELQEIRISQENVHPEKIKLFIDIVSMFKEMLYISKMPQKTTNEVQRYEKKLRELGEIYNTLMYSLMLFANDETIDMFTTYRRFIQEYDAPFFIEKGLSEKAFNNKYVYMMSDLILALRKDIGFPETTTKQDSLLYGILNDWGEVKEEYFKELDLIDKILIED
ncbi:hypothetical protein AFX57_15400, partial [Listeria monocytogenes]|nr:hypothetical protein [Listeria monocytogenes]EAE0320148.1 hypothetical protein [Listeria monocytogenes]EGC1566976.1 hypothetical protein [Listeria monocytogenes]